jgi:hypothetical protein
VGKGQGGLSLRGLAQDQDLFFMALLLQAIQQAGALENMRATGGNDLDMEGFWLIDKFQNIPDPDTFPLSASYLTPFPPGYPQFSPVTMVT